MLRIVFFGTPLFAARALEALISNSDKFTVCAVVTQPDRPAGRGGKLQASPVKQLAEKHSLPVLQPLSVRKEAEFISSLNKFGPFDVGVVAAFGQILPQNVLDLPRTGCVNIHGSLLPRWRGAAPIQRAILAGDKVTGVDLMRMEKGLDTGPMYSRAEVQISDEDTFGTLHDKLAEAGSRLLVKDLTDIVSGQIAPKPQDDSQATYAAKITNEEAKIDWSKSAHDISLQIRGLSPAPGAYAHYKDQRVKIFRAHASAAPMAGANAHCAPGAITLLDSTKVEVQCGSGVLSIEEAQLEGRKRLAIKELLLGAPFSADTPFT